MGPIVILERRSFPSWVYPRARSFRSAEYPASTRITTAIGDEEPQFHGFDSFGVLGGKSGIMTALPTQLTCICASTAWFHKPHPSFLDLVDRLLRLLSYVDQNGMGREPCTQSNVDFTYILVLYELKLEPSVLFRLLTCLHPSAERSDTSRIFTTRHLTLEA